MRARPADAVERRGPLLERVRHAPQRAVEHRSGKRLEQPRPEREIDREAKVRAAIRRAIEFPLVVQIFERPLDIVDADPVGPLLFTRDSTSRVLDQARMLFYGLQANTSSTNLLTTYAVERNVRGIEEYLVAGTIVLEMALTNSRFVRTLTIEKMRSTALAPAQYLFNIVPDRGIVLQGLAESPT